MIPARLDEVDVVRGVALGGMLLVNLSAFSGVALIPLARQSGLDWLASLLILLLADGKFYPLFAFLFGWGIARRQCSAGPVEPAFQRRNMRRMAILALTGLLHAALLWEGDILFAYALLGMMFPFLRRAPLRVMAALILLTLLLSSFLALPGPGQFVRGAYADWITPPLSAWLGIPGHSAWAAGSPILWRASQYLWKLAFFPGWLGNFAALILAGYLVGITQVKIRLSLRVITPLALPLNLFYGLAVAFPRALPVDWVLFLHTAALSLGGPLLALVYASGLARWYQTPRGRVLLEPLRLLGRMPLTTYLCQSLLGALLFSGAAPGSFAPALIWPLAALIFLAQLLFARLWLAHFSRGPLENAWRKLSGE